MPNRQKREYKCFKQLKIEKRFNSSPRPRDWSFFLAWVGRGDFGGITCFSGGTEGGSVVVSRLLRGDYKNTDCQGKGSSEYQNQYRAKGGIVVY